VTDNVAVSIVKINITGPAGFSPINNTMIRIGNTNNYYYNLTYSIAGEYSYYVWVNDTSANENKSIEYHFTIMPTVTTTVAGKEVSVTGAWTGTINVTSVAPPQAPPENLKYIGLYVNVTIIGTLTYANITIKYNESDIAGIEESKLRMYYWNVTENKWKLCENTGVDTANNIVWANVTHLTIFAPMVEKVAEAPPLPTNLFLYIGLAVIATVIVLAAAGIGIKRKKKALPPEKTT
jgi:hypothetical protein